MNNESESSGKLVVQARGELEIVMMRAFDALTKPNLVSRWLLGSPGWTMPTC